MMGMKVCKCGLPVQLNEDECAICFFGRFEKVEDPLELVNRDHCSECGYVSYTVDNQGKCPNCGSVFEVKQIKDWLDGMYVSPSEFKRALAVVLSEYQKLLKSKG